ncbi:hypothetical protein Tco_0713755 [Tanacetum coccineum]
MATTDKESNAAGTDNRPPMLEESDFESWKIRIERYIRGKPLGELIWKSIKNGPIPHPTIIVTTGEGEQQTQVTREKTDEEFTKAENNKERADIQATNIVSQGLPRHIFNTLNQTETEKEIWENVELLMQAKATQSTSSPSQYVPPLSQYAPASQQAPQSTNDVMLATMNQIVNLLNGQIIIENVQRRALGNKGEHAATGSKGKVVTFYNCRGQGHVAWECKEKKRAKDSQWFKDKALLMEAKEKGAILDAEAEAFLADVECKAPYAEPLAITTTTAFKGTSNDIDFHSEVQTYDNYFFDNMNLQVCNNSSSPELNVYFEINKFKDHIKRKDELIRKLKAQIGNMKEVSADSNMSTLEFQALETENTQLKEELIAVRIKNDSLRDENVSIKKHCQDLYKSKAESNSNVSSRAVVPEKPKVLAPGLYAMTPKYVPPQKRNNRETNTSLPRKETVSLVKQTNVCVNLSTGIKSVTEASKSKSKCEAKTHKNLPATRRENVKRYKPLRS